MKKRKDESNIAYLSVDMTVAHYPADYAMRQIKSLESVKPKAWFVDIIHRSTQIPNAIQLEKMLQIELEARNPWQIFGGDAITIRLNMTDSGHLRAKEAMEKIINDARKIGLAENVKYKDETGHDLPIEY